MPCSKCMSDFNLLNWKIKCGECEEKYCNKCLKRREGVLYCEKCIILLKRPPDRLLLMELKSKDIQDYLNKRNISTYGLIEKHELVDLFYKKHIPVKPKRGVEKLTANFAGSVPNLKPINEFFGNLDSVISNGGRSTRSGVPDPQPSPSTKPQTSYTPQASATPHHSPKVESSNGFGEPVRLFEDEPSTSSTESPQNTQPKKESNTEGDKLPPRYPRIDDFKTIEELQSLSAKDLKILLSLNRIDYKGCVEKQELVERAQRLWEDNNEQKKEAPSNLPLQDLCKLCMDAPLDCVLLQCGHMATCIECGKKLAECPICRQYIARVVRTFKA
ncbi:hypothetical protein NQ315_012648 [Exocentrus adspersus]|uniref:RING-type domain-containing protein n=1 Tax=Exocentrus adspersus TaxID=1586481 RepID=A0AAV8VTU8_9CUCU|nr:hypothetical protein NQ315_012648 [Exocentrus adspersus]